jgi:hypothetical protein
MGKAKENSRRDHEPDETSEFVNSSRRPSIDADERDEYEEWRRERGKRGRKGKGKMGGRHRRREVDDY